MKYETFTQLHTPRLLLRQLHPADAECYYSRIAGSEEVTKYMLWEPHKSLRESEESITRVLSKYEQGRCYTWAIALRQDDSLIGRIDLLRFDEESNCCSFAYMLGKDFWGQGFGTEVLTAVFAFAFEKMGIRSIAADHMSENVASGKVMQKAGMRYVGRCASKYEKCGKRYDADAYTITVDDWKRIIKHR